MSEPDEDAAPTKAYRAYRLGSDGHIEQMDIIEAEGDDDAMQAAQGLLNVYGIEVWDEARLVGRAEPPAQR